MLYIEAQFKLKWKFKVLKVCPILIYATIFFMAIFHNNICNKMQTYLLNIE